MANIQQLHSDLLSELTKEPKNHNRIEQILLDVLKADMKAFESAILQVLSFYEMSPADQGYKHMMLGLYLMFLLASKNRLSDFHMVLEKIPQSEQLNNAYIATPVKLEQSLMEGAYNKVVLTEKNMPSPFFTIFIRILMDTVRETIAYSIQKSFKIISIPVATTMLLFENQAQTTEFAQQHSWKAEAGHFVFDTTPTALEKQSLGTTRIAQQMIFYAKQLEMIV